MSSVSLVRGHSVKHAQLHWLIRHFVRIIAIIQCMQYMQYGAHLTYDIRDIATQFESKQQSRERFQTSQCLSLHCCIVHGMPYFFLFGHARCLASPVTSCFEQHANFFCKSKRCAAMASSKVQVSWAWLGQVIVNIMGASLCGLFWSFSPMRTVTKLDCKHVQPGLQKTLIIELLDKNNKNVPYP